MGFAFWALVIGAILLAVGFANSLFKGQPITSAIIYLVIGLILGPTGFSVFHFNPLQQSRLLEILTESAVLISLFAAGVKTPTPFSLKQWQRPIQLAFISMAITVGMVAVFAIYVLNLPLGVAILLGAIVAPTDPVLATDVQVRHPGERDKLRFTLTNEAGMNDGSAFPFVMLGLGLMAGENTLTFAARWFFIDVLWATAGAIAIGIAMGYGVAFTVKKLIQHQQHIKFLDDFIGLGLIGSSYGLSVLLNTWGFLAVFVAAVALRQFEYRFANEASRSQESLTKLNNLKRLKKSENEKKYYFVSESSLVFKEHLERLSELALVILIGGTLFLDSWSWRAIGFAAFMFFVARPVSVHIGLIGTNTPTVLKNLTGWFGVRGIGSLYYLMFAIQHGLSKDHALELIHITLVLVTLSIFIHGTSAKYFLARFWKQPKFKAPT